MVGATGRVRPVGPDIPVDIEVRELDRDVRAELRALPKGAADTVARHLVAAGRFLDTDPARALEHAQAARAQAGRIASVREAVGLAAYHAGEWKLAIGELRAFRRLTGSDVHLAVIADCERALGRPEKAIELAASPEAANLDTETRVELLMVAAGARQDAGDLDGALSTLEVPELRANRASSWLARLRYAYAELLLTAGRVDEAREWFVQSADADVDGDTDADERILDLDGVLFTDEGDASDDDASDDDASDDEASDDEASTGDPYGYAATGDGDGENQPSATVPADEEEDAYDEEGLVSGDEQIAANLNDDGADLDGEDARLGSEGDSRATGRAEDLDDEDDDEDAAEFAADGSAATDRAGEDEQAAGQSRSATDLDAGDEGEDLDHPAPADVSDDDWNDDEDVAESPTDEELAVEADDESPDAVFSDRAATSRPDPSPPSTQTPPAPAPHVTAPQFAAPQFAAPQFAAPDFETPDVSPSDVDPSDVSTPDVSPFGVSASDVSPSDVSGPTAPADGAVVSEDDRSGSKDDRPGAADPNGG
ncbi:hypothetical protein [Cryptosporangium sp. NPDC051539]|uniref:hypothetical protein n=1 Tax=Cryptosporangium sp. NPDC051539 TaxID=3363962 RepID=UPI00379DA621